MPGQFSSTNFFISPYTSPTLNDLNIYKWVMEPSENILERIVFEKRDSVGFNNHRLKNL